MSTEFDSPAPSLTPSVGKASAQGPTEPVPRHWTTVFSLVWCGYWMANLVPLQLLLPQQLEVIDPAS
jgi:hypothetical protein